MSIEDIKECFDVSNEKLEKVLVSLEKKSLAKLTAQKKVFNLPRLHTMV